MYEQLLVVTTGYQDKIAASFNQNSFIVFKYILKNFIFELFKPQGLREKMEDTPIYQNLWESY